MQTHRFLTILILASLAISAPLAAGESPPAFAFSVDLHFPNQPYGDMAQAVGVDASNNIYVSSANLDRVLKLSSTGNLLTNWAVLAPACVAFDSSGNVYVVDRQSGQVQKFSADGKLLTHWQIQGQLPFGLAVDSKDKVYVTDAYADRVQKFTTNGTFLAQWGSPGTNQGQFTSPLSIATDTNDRVYVLDAGNNNIQVFASDGTYLSKWGGPGTSAGQLSGPESMALDRAHDVLYIADTQNSRIQKFTTSGVFLTEWGTNGTGIGELSGPLGVAVDASGNMVYVADTGNFRLQVFAYAPEGPPVVVQQPRSQSVIGGTNVTFEVAAFGAPPLTYQWQFQGSNLPGATQAQITVTNAGILDAGGYAVTVTNALGSALSSSAQLSFLPAGAATFLPSSITTTSAVLNASLTQNGLFAVASFQWGTTTNYGQETPPVYLGGGVVSAAVSSALTNLQPNTIYQCRAVLSNGLTVTHGKNVNLKTLSLAPFATTRSASVLGRTGAQLNGMVTPSLGDATVWFEWGTDNGYGNLLVATNLQASLNLVAVHSVLSALSSNYFYHFRLVASNSFGVTYGADEQFALGRRVFAWGQNSLGQTNVPGGLNDAVGVAAGSYHGLAVRADGTVAAWGATNFHQAIVPDGLANVVTVAAGTYHSLALKADGTLAAWGVGPTNIPAGLTGVVAIASGSSHNMALKNDGTVVAWGVGNFNPGQTNVPYGLNNVVAIAASGNHCLALRHDGLVVAWGDNGCGETDVPADLSNVTAVAAGTCLSLAVTGDGKVAAWGDLFQSQYLLPKSLTNVVALSAGDNHSVALRKDGTVLVWGDNFYGQQKVPAAVSNVVAALAAGGNFTLALGPRVLAQAFTSAATSIVSDGAVLNGTVVPGGLPTGAIFNGEPLPTMASPPCLSVQDQETTRFN
jgi:DNA-binding beta-propeller fold protein YncE